MKILLISSTGDHFYALQKLETLWEKHECCWVTFKTSYTERFLGNQKKVYWAYRSTTFNLINLIRNLKLAWQVINSEAPDLVIATSSSLAIPFLLWAKFKGVKTTIAETCIVY